MTKDEAKDEIKLCRDYIAFYESEIRDSYNYRNHGYVHYIKPVNEINNWIRLVTHYQDKVNKLKQKYFFME